MIVARTSVLKTISIPSRWKLVAIQTDEELAAKVNGRRVNDAAICHGRAGRGEEAAMASASRGAVAWRGAAGACASVLSILGGCQLHVDKRARCSAQDQERYVPGEAQILRQDGFFAQHFCTYGVLLSC